MVGVGFEREGECRTGKKNEEVRWSEAYDISD